MLHVDAVMHFARILALAANGGDWDRDYTPEQRDRWAARARLIMLREI